MSFKHEVWISSIQAAIQAYGQSVGALQVRSTVPSYPSQDTGDSEGKGTRVVEFLLTKSRNLQT